MKHILLFLLIYFFAVLQSSFLVHFSFSGFILNPIIILVVILSFTEKEKSHFALFSALIGGLIIDIFSSHIIGYYTLVLVLISILIKQGIRNYVRIPFAEKI